MDARYNLKAVIFEGGKERVMHDITGSFDETIRAYDGYCVIMRKMKKYRENMANLSNGYAMESYRGDGARVLVKLSPVK